MTNFLRRTATGAGIVIFIMGGFWLHPVSFILTGLVLLIGTQSEYYILIRKSGADPERISGLITGISLYILASLTAAGILESRYFLLLIPLVICIFIMKIYRTDAKPFDSLSHTFFPVIYVAVPYSLIPFTAFAHSGLESLVPLAGITFSPGIIIGFFLLIWANDTGAYLAGISFGKHRLIERVSPKKTWEGFIGGIVSSAAVAWLLSGWLGVVHTEGWVIIALIVSITGTYGDLFESLLKRSAGVKDSGDILPGHGGFLDRFDSTLMSLPLVYLFISLFG